MPSTAAWLADEDWNELAVHAQRARFPSGSVIVHEGERPRGLFVLVEGIVRVERSGVAPGIAIARFGAGEMFGEMSLLEDTTASASVIAESNVEVDVIAHTILTERLAANVSLGTRVYRALAMSLSQRLRNTSARLFGGSVEASKETVDQGLFGEKAVPPTLVLAVAQFRAALWDVEQARWQISGEDAADAVSVVCSALVTELDEHLRIASEESRSALAAYVLREAFPVLMTSLTFAQCREQVRATSANPELIDRILANAPHGDGALGEQVDAWFLARPTFATRREASAWAAREIVRAFNRVGETVSVLTLGAQSHDLVNAMTRGVRLAATIIDPDVSALQYATTAIQAATENVTHVSAIQARIVDVCNHDAEVMVESQHVICALGVCDSLDDTDARCVIEWAIAHLAAGGVLLLDATRPESCDRSLMEGLAGRGLFARSDTDLKALFAGLPARATLEPAPHEVSTWITVRADVSKS